MADFHPTKAIVIAGPTASGKSALALELAECLNGVIINADSMQIYRDLRIVTARPSPQDEARIEHRLYGILPMADICSAGRWSQMAALAMQEIWEQGKLPIITGGTGLYINALVKGLSPLPDIPEQIRHHTRQMLKEMGNLSFHALLAKRDPLSAASLHPQNSQRLARAWEVIEATGRSLAEWRMEPRIRPIEARWQSWVIDPPRAALYAQCDQRFVAMIEEGALQEIDDMIKQNPAGDLPLLKAVGVAELMAYRRGEMGLQEAMTQAQQATRNYAKRQGTWFRHQMDGALLLTDKISKPAIQDCLATIRRFLLTEEV